MKPHLPKTLRCALLACLASIPAWAPTIATGVIGGGLLALAFCGEAAGAAEERVSEPVPYVGTIYTWVGTTADIHEMTNYRETTRDGNGGFVLAETAPSEGWGATWNTPRIPNVIRFDGTDAKQALDFSFQAYCLSGIIVEKGATGYSISTAASTNPRNITIGNSGAETAYSTINEDFSISNAAGKQGSPITLRGTQEWTIAKDATLTLLSSVPIAHSGNLMIQGGGTADFASGLSLETGSRLEIADGASVVVVGSFANNGGTISNSTAGSLVLQDVAAANLTVGAGSYYTLSGISSLAGGLTVEEGGTLDVSRLYQFDWCRLDGTTIEFNVNGTVVGGATPHIFAGDDRNLNRYAYYDEASKQFIAKQWQDEDLLHWVGGTSNNSWSAGANWQIGNETLAATPEAGRDLRLLGTGTIVIDRDISQNRLIFGQQSNFTFVIGSEYSAVLNAGCVLREGARLGKDGAGSLTMTKDRARQLRVSVLAGSLVLSDTLQNQTPVDLSPLTVQAGGDVSVALAGGLGGSGNYGILDLGDSFYGSLTIRSGVLHATHNDTHLGNVSKFVLGDMGGLMVNQEGAYRQDIHIVTSGFLNVYGVPFAHTGKLTGGSDTVFYTYGFGDARSKTTFHDLTGFHGMLNLTTHDTTMAGNQGDVSIQGLLLNKFNNDVTLNIEAGTNVHIVGENNSVTENVGSFLLAYGHPDRPGGTGTINIAGSLVSEAGISTSPNKAGALADGRVGTVNVQSGGVLQLNKGVRGDSRGLACINVQAGGTLKVSGMDSAVVDDRFTINMQGGSILQGGAGGTDATVNQHIAIQDGSTVNVGAVNGKTLTLSASALSTVTGGTLNIVGDAAGGKVVLDSLQHAQVSLNAGANVELIGETSLTKIEVVDGATAVLSGSTALAEGLVVQAGGTAAITGDSVFLADVENNGTLDLSGLTQLTIGALQKAGAEVKIGSFLLPEGTDIIGLITPTVGVKITHEGDYLRSTGLHLYWKGQPAEGEFYAKWDNATENWSASAEATAGDMQFNEKYIAEFGAGGCSFVQVATDGVSTPAVHVTGDGYSFSGGTIATAEIRAEKGVWFAGVAALEGRLDIEVAEGVEISINRLEGNGSDSIRVLGKSTLDLYGTKGSFGALSVERLATLKLASYGSDEVVLKVGNTTLGSAIGYAKNLVIQDGAVTPEDATAVAELHDVNLVAGTEGQHATVSGVQFTGDSNTWGGYLDMGNAAAVAVAGGSSLSISESGLVVDLGKVQQLEAEHTVVSLADGSTLNGWDGVRFFYNGIEMASHVLARESAGKVTVALGDNMDAGTSLYWDGTPGSAWNATETNWSGAEGTEGSLAFKAFGNVQFGNVPTGGVKTVVQEATLPVGNISVTAGGYAFSGAPIKSYGRLDVSAVGVTRFGPNVEVAKGVRLGNHEESALEGITTAVTFEGNLKAGSLTLQCGTADAPQAVQGTYTFQGIEVGTAIFDVDDMRLGGMNDAAPRVVVNGALKANEIYIQGNAAKAFNGVITSSKVYISAGGDDHNVVVFGAQGNDIDRLELSHGAKLSIANDGQNITDIVVGDALLRFELTGGNYNNGGAGYNIYSSHDNALLELAGITYTTIGKLSGREEATGEFHSITIDSMGRSLAIKNVENMKDLTILSGVGRINGVAAGGGVHRDLVIKEEASVQIAADNIMAQGSRVMRVEKAILQLLGTTQTLYAAAGGTGNAMYLDYADILGSSTGTGIHVTQAAPGTAGTLNATFKHNNGIGANMMLEAGTTTHFIGDAGASLTLSGIVSGSGNVSVEGAGSSVALLGQNTLTGTVTVGDGAELVIGNKDALGNAHLVMGANSALSLETRGQYPVALKTLVLGDNATINIDRLEGTDYANASKAAFGVDSWSVGAGNSLTLNFTFGAGVGMDAVKTYNIFASTQDIAKTPLGALNIWYADESGQLVRMDSKNYIYNYTQVGDKWVFFIRTRFGNIWQGDSATGSGFWSMDNAADGGNWQDGQYREEGVAYNNAIFADLKGSDGTTTLASVTVTLVNEVHPGNVYFDARDTGYLLQETGSGKLAADTVIHTSGLGDVTLDLANNATTENAIAGMLIHRGIMSLSGHDLAFSGSIAIDPVILRDIALDTGSQYVVSGQYKAQGKFWGVTLGQGSIAGTPEALQAGKSRIEKANIIANEAGSVTLSNVALQETGSVKNAIIGSGVSIGANGNYTLSGTVWFEDTLKLADGAHVTIADDAKIDIGGLRPDMKYDDINPDNTVYTYTMMQSASGGDVAAGSAAVPHGKTDMLLLNGVALSSIHVSGESVQVNYCRDADNNIIPGKIQLTLKGGDFTPWDERWGSKGPVVAVTNMGDSVLYDGNAAAEQRDKYLYSNIVTNGSEDIVVASISRTWGSADGEEKIPLIGSTGTNKEIWIYNHGSGNFSTLVTGSATAGSIQSGATHLMVMGGQAGENTVTVGGSRDATQTGESYVTLDGENTIRGIVMGGSYGLNQAVTQTGASHLYMNNGQILTMLIAGSYEADMAADTYLGISGGTIKTVYGGSYATNRDRGNTAGNITAKLTGGTIETFYGGGTGNTGGERKAISVTVDGAQVDTLYASNNGGIVTGDIVLDLVSGTAETVKVASLGTEVHGSYVVRLHQGFTLGNVTGSDNSIKGIYGGHGTGSGLAVKSDFTSRLELVDVGATYDFFPGAHNNNEQIREILGFDEIALADKVTLRVDNRHFCNVTDVTLSTLNKGDMATVVFGKANPTGSGSSSDLSRTGSITLEEGITFKFETSFGYGDSHAAISRMPIIHVRSGSMVDLTGFPREQGTDDYGGSISFRMHLAGDGIDGKGALYKGAGEYSTSPDGKVAMPHIMLDDNASVNAAASNIIVCGDGYADTYLELQGHTMTKIGAQALRFYASQEAAPSGTPGVGGTFFIKEGAVDYLKRSNSREVDYVLGKEGALSLTQHGDGTSLVLRSLSGNGTVNLTKNTKLTLESDYKTAYGVFCHDWLSQGKYNNANSGGYAYGVFSGKIVSDDASSEFIKSGPGTQLLSGSDSTYQGLTKIQQGILYLVGTSVGELTAPGESANVQKGVVGQSSLVWESVDGSKPVLLLGEGVRIFNNGYALDGSEMTIEVEAARQGSSAMDFVVKDAQGNWVTVEADGKVYYQMDTARIKSVNATGFYADAAAGQEKAYTAGAEIDRNRTLYLSADELGMTVGSSLQQTPQTIHHTIRECEQINVSKLLSTGLTSLDCNGYYGNGTAYAAGTVIDAALAEANGGLFVTLNGMSPTAGRYLQYESEPSIAYVPDSEILAEDGGAAESGAAANSGTPYVQYDLGGLKDPGLVPESLRGKDALFYVKILWKDDRGMNSINRYMTYAGVQAVADGKIGNASLISIDRVLFKEDATLTEAEQAAVAGLDQVMTEAHVVQKDITITLEGLEVKDGVASVAANGYYVDTTGKVLAVYHAGDEINRNIGTLIIPATSQNQSVVIVTGLNDSGYEEATYSGVLSDNGNESPSHLTKIGQGTLTIDQRNLYSGDTNLREGTLNLKGWGQLQRKVDRSASRFNQSKDTSLKLSYDGSYQDEATELSTDLVITGKGDARWTQEETTENRTAALISDVGEKVSFTLSGDISGDGNVLHSGKGQLHISGANSYEGGTTVTDGVLYVESATALGATASDNMAAKVVVTKHTADGKGGTLVITNNPDGIGTQGNSGYVRFNSNRNAIEGTVYIGGYQAGAGTDILTGAGADDSAGATLLMTGNGYWAEKTILSSKSALIFNGTASTNKEMAGSSIIHEAGLLVGSGVLAVSGPAGIGTTVRFADIGNATTARAADAEGFQGSIRVEGNNARLEIGAGNYRADEGKYISISGYNATLEAANSEIAVGSGGKIQLYSLGHQENENDYGAAVLQAKSVTVEAGGSLVTRNISTTFRYNLAAIEEATQISTHETLIGHRDPNSAPDPETNPEQWKDLQASSSLGLATKVETPYAKSYLQPQAVNTNRSAIVDSDVSLASGSTYEVAYANTSLGRHALTLESKGGDYNAANRVILDLSLNGDILQWDNNGRSTSQIVLFTGVNSVTLRYNGKEVNTDDLQGEIFYMAAQDFLYDAYEGRYIDQNTVLVYDRGAQIVYLDRALPEPATATLSLLALAALVARRRRK